MTSSEVILIIGAAGFGFMGIAAILVPARVARQFEVTDLTVVGRNEVRAVYGGFGIAIAAVLIWAMLVPDLGPGICLTVAAALGGMAIGRACSAIMDRKVGIISILYLCLEAIGAVLIAIAA